MPVEAINGLIYVYFIAHYLALENKLWGSSLEKKLFFSLWQLKITDSSSPSGRVLQDLHHPNCYIFLVFLRSHIVEFL